MKKATLKFSGETNFFFQEAFKTLRSNLQFCGCDVNVILITSSNENEGKTSITLNLAKSFAELNKKVLIVDADMRKSVMITRISDVKDPFGLSEYLTGLQTMENVLYETQIPGLDIIFSGKYPPNPVELLESKYFEKFIADMREKYDYIIVDSAPLGLVIDAAVIAPRCDGTAIVISESSKYSQVKATINQLEKSNSKILGVIRNKNNYNYVKRYYTSHGDRVGYGKRKFNLFDR